MHVIGNLVLSKSLDQMPAPVFLNPGYVGYYFEYRFQKKKTGFLYNYKTSSGSLRPRGSYAAADALMARGQHLGQLFEEQKVGIVLS